MSETYQVRAENGTLYGPVDLETLRQWAGQGRVLKDSILIDSAQQEIRAADLPGLFASEVPPPPVAGGPPQPTYPTTEGYAPPAKSGMPVWAIVVIVVVAVCGLGGIVMAAILFPVFGQAKYSAKKATGMSRMKRLTMSLMMYSTDNDDHFPLTMDSAEAIRPALGPYVSDPEIILSANPDGGAILGNPKLARRSVTEVVAPANTLLFYDSKPWQDNSIIGFDDGHVSSKYRFSEIDTFLSADPFK